MNEFAHVATLIDLILTQLGSGALSLGRVSCFVPEYLMRGADWDRRARVQRGLYGLRLILTGAKPDNGEPDQDWTEPLKALERSSNPTLTISEALLAILYSACADRYQNLYELRAANRMLGEFEKEACRIGGAIRDALGNPDEPRVDVVATLILYHKMADRVVYERLSKAVHKRILVALVKSGGDPLHIGLVAAANYNSSGELNHPETSRLRIRAILEGWVDAGCYQTGNDKYQMQRSSESSGLAEDVLESYDVLWDYPLCVSGVPGEESMTPLWKSRRYQFDSKAFVDFCGWVERTRSSMFPKPPEHWWHTTKEGFFLTINYAQSRFLLARVFRELLHQGRDSPIYENSALVLDKIGNLDERLGLGSSVTVLEFRALPAAALLVARGERAKGEAILGGRRVDEVDSGGADSQDPIVNGLSDLEALVASAEVTSRPDSDRPNYFLTPVAHYLPLPLLVRYLRVASALSDRSGEDSLFGSCELVMEGGLEQALPDNVRLVVPAEKRVVAEDSPVDATIERLIAAHAVNLGLVGGFDRLSLRDESGWAARVTALLNDKQAGFELLVRYIETYMRSHDVHVRERMTVDDSVYWGGIEKLREARWSRTSEWPNAKNELWIGVDIGASTAKFLFYEACWQSGTLDVKELEEWTFRRGVTRNEGDLYTSLDDFAEFLISHIEAWMRERSNNRVRLSGDSDERGAGAMPGLDRVAVMGVCWPGPVREQKIAGASGILKNFADTVASHFIRRTTVEQVRALDLVAALRRSVSSRLGPGDRKPLTIGLCNDAYAEGLGRMVRDFGKLFPPGRSLPEDLRWGVLKLGSGTASAVVTPDRILKGPAELGKLVVNVYSAGTHKLDSTNQTPKGQLNEFASTKLLPYVYKQVMGGEFEPDSIEIGRCYDCRCEVGKLSGSPDSKDKSAKQIYCRLRLELGLDFLNRTFMGRSLETPTLDDWYPLGEFSAGNMVEAALHGWRNARDWRLGLSASSNEEVCRRAWQEGGERLAMLCNYDPDHWDLGDSLQTELWDFGRLGEVIDRAASLLADGVMVMYEYYRISGVVLCGGVLRGYAGGRIVDGIRRHLDLKYSVDLEGIESFETDTRHQDQLGKKKRTTIYYFTNQGLKLNSEGTEDVHLGTLGVTDRGEIGALSHAFLVRSPGGSSV